MASGQPCLNEFDCQLLTLTKVLQVISPTAIVRAVSVGSSVHSTCVVDFMRIATRTERQEATVKKTAFKT